ncbi:MAG: hypothetical protein BWY93_02205 [Euryarchaeota archaeon ADurb.BinA087]|nr:MAG: hypothetical protein BWY93_02205 [Euryarchaeota archaeon ADurb.BinA087]
MLCTEQLLQPVPGKVLGHVMKFTAAVVPFSRVSFGVLIGHDRSHCLEDCFTDKVLRRYQLKPVLLPEPLFLDD